MSDFENAVVQMNEALAIARDIAVKSPEQYEEWIERIKGPGKWCPLCDWVYPEKHYDMTTPMPHSKHCPYRRAVALVASLAPAATTKEPK